MTLLDRGHPPTRDRGASVAPHDGTLRGVDARRLSSPPLTPARRRPYVNPDPPAWILAAGLPAPLEREDLYAYASRLGVDPIPLYEGLDERTADIASLRFAAYCQRAACSTFRKHLRAIGARYG